MNSANFIFTLKAEKNLLDFFSNVFLWYWYSALKAAETFPSFPVLRVIMAKYV